MYTSCWIKNVGIWIGFPFKCQNLGYILQTFSNVIVQIDIVWFLFETRIETKLFANWTKATLLRIYFHNLSVQKSCLHYKSQCLEKVNVKYVINRLWHEIFHIVPGISPGHISLQLGCRAWYGSLWMIQGPIWKMSCNNLLLRDVFRIGLVISPRVSVLAWGESDDNDRASLFYRWYVCKI
jgi:hypothetical protein